MRRQGPSSAGWTLNRPTSGRRALHFDELWEYREVAAYLALRDLKIRYKQAAFGVTWAVLQPLAATAVFIVVFNRLAHVGAGPVPYVLFALLGSAVWTYLSSALSQATDTFVRNSALITKVYFPRLAAPLAAVMPDLIGLGISLVVVGIFMIGYGVGPGVAILTLPLWILVLVSVTFAVGLLLATLNVKYRDAHNAFTPLTQLWLFASPVAYPPSLVHGNWAYVYFLNPMAGILQGFRWALFNTPISAKLECISLFSGLVLLVLGLRYFQSAERQFADVI